MYNRSSRNAIHSDAPVTDAERSHSDDATTGPDDSAGSHLEWDEDGGLSATICIVGLGYVGIPLATAFDGEGYDVIGYDIDETRIESFEAGRDPTGEFDRSVIDDCQVDFTADPAAISRADYVLLTVPTPLDKVQNPELEYVTSATRTVADHLTEGTTVVLESTVYPGVTRNVVVPIIEEHTGFTLGEEFAVGYSPERLSPGQDGKRLSEAVKIVAGDSEETVDSLSRMYGSIVDAGVYPAPSIETAEAAKVLENVQRDLNIALMNELAIICEHLGLDTHEVIDAAATKWNFHEYTPGLVGGHCIPVDPLYLAHGSERAGFSPKLIFQGREVNEYMPKHLAELTIKALNATHRVPRDSSLLVLGASYKPNVSDIRTSEVETYIRMLEEYDVDCVVHDPIADDDLPEVFDVAVTTEPTVGDYDGIVLATHHEEFLSFPFADLVDDFERDPIFIDVGGVLDKTDLQEAGYEYRRL